MDFSGGWFSSSEESSSNHFKGEEESNIGELVGMLHAFGRNIPQRDLSLRLYVHASEAMLRNQI